MSDVRSKLVGAAVLHGAGPDAEDAAQESICRFIEWSRTHEARNPVAWMYVTTLNIVRSTQRRRHVPLTDTHASKDEYGAVETLVDWERVAPYSEIEWLARYTEVAREGWRRNQHTGRGITLSGKDKVKAMRLRRRLSYAT